MRIFQAALAMLAITLFFSCEFDSGKRVDGNGNIVSQARNVTAFTGVEVSGDIDVYVKQDSSTSVKIEADENLQQYLEVETRGGTLYIREQEGFNLRSDKQIKAYVSAAQLDHFRASGACNFHGDGRITSGNEIEIHLSGACDADLDVKAPKISAEGSGASSFNLRGETKDFDVDGSGSTDLKCFDLLTENTSIDISGAGTAQVYASVKLSIELSGAANVKYKGNASVSKSVSGAATVEKVD